MGAPDDRPNLAKVNGPVPGMDSRSRETLRTIIAQWNANRLDLFELSEPDANMEFHGVMRFYFQDDAKKIATKCVRVSSLQTSRETVEILVEKFRPDMRMLSLPRFELYEVHANGEERRLKEEEKPLLVQLNWHKDDREGRFLLKNEDQARGGTISRGEVLRKSERRLSKDEKKEIKKKEKEQKLKDANESLGIPSPTNENETDADRLFKQLPETSFHRSISNPEAVMRRRRQQKLEKKLQQYKSKDGGPDTGGTLKIFGETINPDVPYKTLLLSVHDTAEVVIKQTLEKYGLDREDSAPYCLVQAVLPPGSSAETVDPSSIKEKILDTTDCPLQILMNFPPEKGLLVFNLKRRMDLGKSSIVGGDNWISRPLLVQNPYLVEILRNGLGQAMQLFPGTTEVGNDHLRLGAANFFHLVSPDVSPSHCFFQRGDGKVTVSPVVSGAYLTVDGRNVDATVPLQNGSVVRIGQNHVFRFFMPPVFNGVSEGTAPQANRERLQLPLVSIAQPKRSPDMTRNDLSSAVDHADPDVLDTNSSVTSRRSSPDVHLYSRQNGGMPFKSQILPATLEFREEREDAFLISVIAQQNPNSINFKLSPTYVLYMAARYRASTNFRPEIIPQERAHLLAKFLKKIAAIFLRVVEDNHTDSELLAFWLANASELLHLLKLDRHMSPYGTDAHDMLADCIHLAFHHLIRCQQEHLQSVLPKLFATDKDGTSAGWGNVLHALSSAMFLLRRCRLNAGLTIQLFSRLFHFINMWLFNTLIHHPQRCSRHFGSWLRGGLDHVLQWAEKQGLELAADCYLSKIIQATNLLVMPKTEENPANYASDCYRLNSYQVRYLLQNYNPGEHEHPLTAQFTESAVATAKSLVDEPALLSGLSVQLEEEPDLQVQFLLPEDGYSVDVVTGLPGGLKDFLEPLTRNRICEMTVHPASQGLWTVYLTPLSGDRSPSMSYDGSRQLPPPQHLPHVIEVAFPRGNSGIGLSIIAVRGQGQDKLGIYIKSVVKGGAADKDGRLKSGDQLLKVNGKSLIGVTQDRAAELIAQSGSTVHLEVMKQGAVAHGIATLLESPSPPLSVPKPSVPDTGMPQRNFAHVPGQTWASNGNGMRSDPSYRQNHQYDSEFGAAPAVRFSQPAPPPPLVHNLQFAEQRHPASLRSPAASTPVNDSENDARRYFPPSTARVPSPVREIITNQMHTQRDKIRQDAKFFEMEDELRRRREHIQQVTNGERSPVNNYSSYRPPPPVVARPLVNGQRSQSVERIDRSANGKPPTEKRVQWAIDSPKKSPSPTVQQRSPVPNYALPLPADSQVVRVPVLPSPSAVPHRPIIAEEIHSWSRGFQDRVDRNGSPSNTPWQREEHQRWKQSRVQEARRLRDEEIALLQSRQNLSETEKERLRTLLLERDFQRRAEEVIHRDDEEGEEMDEDEDGDEEDGGLSGPLNVSSSVVVTHKIAVPKTTPHLHHPTAAASAEVYKTRQQEDYDTFIRRHEVHAVNEAIKRSREHLDTTSNGPQVRFQEQTYQYPVSGLQRASSSPVRSSDNHSQHNNHQSELGEKAGSPVKRQTKGAEIRDEVEASRPSMSSVVGVHEIYNDPRNRILSAKVKPLQQDDTSPEKLSFRDKMRMFATTVGENPKDRISGAGIPRNFEGTEDYS